MNGPGSVEAAFIKSAIEAENELQPPIERDTRILFDTPYGSYKDSAQKSRDKITSRVYADHLGVLTKNHKKCHTMSYLS
jgi:hypothetical protein